MKLKNKNRFIIITLIVCVALLSPIFGCKNSTPTEKTKTAHENVGEKEKTDSKNPVETKSENAEDEKSVEEENTKTIINDFSDLSEDFLKEFEDYAMSCLSEINNDKDKLSDVVLEKVNYYDRKMAKEDIDIKINNDDLISQYALIMVYHVEYTVTFYKDFSSRMITNKVFKATNFKLTGGKITADFYDESFIDDMGELVKGLNFNGFGLAGKEEFFNKRAQIEANLDNMEGVINLLKQDDFRLGDVLFEVLDKANVRELPSLDSPVVLTVDSEDHISFMAYYMKKTPDGRTWYFVYTNQMKDYDYNYCGWVSDRVLKRAEVG